MIHLIDREGSTMGTTEQEIRRERLRRMKEQDKENERAVAELEASHDAALAQADALDAEAQEEASGEPTTVRRPAAKKTGRKR